MTTLTCPVAYDHDDDPCAVCGWDPNAVAETRMDPDAWAAIQRKAAMLNAYMAGGCCPGPEAERAEAGQEGQR